MTAILRWFDHDGRRHRVWFRRTPDDERELVVAGPDWQVGLGNVPCSSLDELTDEDLTRFAENGRACTPAGEHGRTPTPAGEHCRTHAPGAAHG
jgi:hypothetical protein